MVIRLPESVESMRSQSTRDIKDLTPREIVAELDKYIVGQAAAKRAVAIAIRNRRRRLRLPEDLRDEVAPNNIILMGPTGVGKTAMARALGEFLFGSAERVTRFDMSEYGDPVSVQRLVGPTEASGSQRSDAAGSSCPNRSARSPLPARERRSKAL